MTTVDRKINRVYIVEDYTGPVDKCLKLADARKALKDTTRGCITAVTTEVITIRTEEIIQHRRNS
jgi:hypothetical protein